MAGNHTNMVQERPVITVPTTRSAALIKKPPVMITGNGKTKRQRKSGRKYVKNSSKLDERTAAGN